MKSIIASAVVALSALMAQAASSNHVVTVGAGGALAYSPNNLVAAVGDTITFQFVAGVTPHTTIVYHSLMSLEPLGRTIYIRCPLCAHQRYDTAVGS